MSGDEGASRGSEILASRVRLPQHVVYREFVNETVMLNLETGQYHGVNPTGGRMLLALEKAETVGGAAAEIAGEFGVAVAQVEADITAFCDDLLERDLIEVEEAQPEQRTGAE